MAKLPRQMKPVHGAAAKAKRATVPKAKAAPPRPSAKDRPKSYYEAAGDAAERLDRRAAALRRNEHEEEEEDDASAPAVPWTGGNGAATLRRARAQVATTSQGLSGNVTAGDSDANDDDVETSGQVEAASSVAAPVGFAAAMAKILSREVPAAKNPVLAKRHTASAKLAAADKAAAKAERERKREKRDARRAHIVEPASADQEFERQLRKVASRGVVALFNAISKHQRAVVAAADGTAAGAASVDAALASAPLSAGGRRGGSASATAGASAAPAPGVGATFLELLSQSTHRASGASVSAAPVRGAATALPAATRRPGASSWAVLREDFAQQAGEGADESSDDDGIERGRPVATARGGRGILDDSDDE